MKTIYLAHSPSEKSRGKFVQQLLEDAGYKVINPFNEAEKVGIHIKDTTPGTTDSDVVNMDICNIHQSDAMVCLFPYPALTVGIPCEMTIAHLLEKIPIVSFTPATLINHPWIVKFSNKVFLVNMEKDLLILTLQELLRLRP
jgi:hypothetical protein